MSGSSLGDVPSDRFERLFVWGVLAGMSFALLAYLSFYGRNLPYWDDWTLVPVLSGDRPASAAWLWSQENEHRIPFTKLVLVVLAGFTNGDWRAGTYASGLILCVLALGMIVVARRVRGVTSYADAFFPLLLLHWGHYPNLLLQLQLLFVGSVALSCAVMLFIVDGRWVGSWKALLGLGACFLLLPLHGVLGLAVGLPMALWIVYAGAAGRRYGSSQAARRRIFLWVVAAVAIGLSGLYFIGYESVSRHPPSPGPAATLRTAVEVIGGSVGIGARFLWPFSGVGVMVFLLASVALLGRTVVRNSAERVRATGLLLFLGGIGAVALVIGVGRASFGPGQGLMDRYVLLSVPALCAAYYAWGLYASPAAGRFVQISLFAVACALLAPNLREGAGAGHVRRNIAEQLQRDVRAGMPPAVLAERYRQLYPFKKKSVLARGLERLRRARRGPYASLDPQAAAGGECSSDVAVRPERVGAHQMTWEEGRGRGEGNDPFTIFALDGPRSVCAIRLSFALVNARGAPAHFQVFWKRQGENEFTDGERNAVLSVYPSTAAQTATVWVFDTIDRFRVDPDTTSVEFTLLEIGVIGRAGGEPGD